MPPDAPQTPEGDRTPQAEPQREPKPRSGTMRVRADPETDPRAAAQIHTVAVAATVHANGLAQRIGERLVGLDYGQSSNTYAEDVFARMAPRDPVEEMLIAQLIATQTRAVHLADLALAQRDSDPIRITNEYADRACNTYRRLMLALAEYRRPARGGDTHIRQANIAAQQVVLNPEQAARNANGTNEQGYERPESPQTLQALPEGPGIPPGIGTPDAALGSLHRTEDG